MHALRKFFFSSSPEKVLAIRACTAVVGAWMLVRLCPYAVLRRRLHAGPHVEPAAAQEQGSERIVQMVLSVSRRIPMTTCLVDAVAAQNLLASYGHTSTLRIGVRMDEHHHFAAHAWLEDAGRVLIGGALSPGLYKALEIGEANASHARKKL